MQWSWEQKGWPCFSWNERKLKRVEALFAEGAGVVIGASKHLEPADRENLTVELMSFEAVDTSAIEGEALDRDSIRSSIRKHLGLASDRRRVGAAEAGIAEVMTDLYKGVRELLAEAPLHRWHRLITNGRTDLADVGRYRHGTDPMQIVSGPIGRRKVHFEAPPAGQVPQEMKRFWAWLAKTGPNGDEPLAPVTRAGIAHIWFESIHPYEDGNGRIGRALSEKLLAEGLPTPVFTGMAGTLLLHRKAYYAALERAHTDLDLTDWLLWFAAKTIEAQRRTLQQVEFVLAKDRTMRELHGRINARQEKVLLRLFEAGPTGFLGGLSAANYISITGAPTATTTRDLAGLVSLGALKRSGEFKATRYQLDIAVSRVESVEIADIVQESK